MKKLVFNISIKAPREKVWSALWEDKSYREWTSVFTPESHALSDWKEGSKVLFLDGKGNGMSALIEKKIGNTEMVFKHISEIKNGKEHALKNTGYESYFLSEKSGGTDLRVEVDIEPEWEEHMAALFPKALEGVKRIAER
jgi:uncharacterized protein YndB with AHSA1/START domain